MAWEVRQRLGTTPVRLLGEETLRDPNIDLTDWPGLVILSDILDGSDLAERSLSNWCSAATICYPRERRILGTYVAMPDLGAIFCVTETMNVPVRYPIRGKGYPKPISGPSRIRELNF
jgi:hypothetical protein